MLPYPNYFVIGPNIRGFAAAGATNYFPEGEEESNGGEMAELKTYVVSKMLWDPTLNDTALVAEFLAGYYGPAAGSMREYMDAFVEAAAPSAAGGGGERRFARGDCVRVADRVWARGGWG